MQVKWSSAARRDLVRLHDFLHPVSPRAAGQTVKILIAAVDKLSAYPEAKKPVLYYCVRTATVEPGKTSDFTFQVVALKAVSGQYAGMYAFGWEDPTSDERNNTAHVTINAVTAAASSAPPANAPSADGDQGGDQGSDQGGEQLAATGSG